MKIKMEEAKGIAKLKECGLSEVDAANMLKFAAERYEQEGKQREIRRIIKAVVEGEVVPEEPEEEVIK